MATNLDSEEKLIEEIKKLGKFKTKKEAVNAALSEYSRRLKQGEILKYFGKVEYFDNHDYRRMRGKPGA